MYDSFERESKKSFRTFVFAKKDLKIFVKILPKENSRNNFRENFFMKKSLRLKSFRIIVRMIENDFKQKKITKLLRKNFSKF